MRKAAVDDFSAACDFLFACSVDGWRLAMMKIGKLPSVNSEIQAAFLRVWIESKMLPLKVGDRRVLADALHILMRAGYTGAPLTLYRGTSTMRLDVEFTGSAGRQISSSQEALLSIGRTRTSRTQASCCRH